MKGVLAEILIDSRAALYQQKLTMHNIEKHPNIVIRTTAYNIKSIEDVLNYPTNNDLENMIALKNRIVN
jgi:hypothetical protein